MDAVTISIVCSVLGSSGMFAFVQFMINRKDKKEEKLDNIAESLDDVKKYIESMESRFTQNMDAINDKIDKNQAIQARIRILRASDEMRQHVHHSYEYFRQLHKDITEYEAYCLVHPEFKNNEAVNSIAYINKIYQQCLDRNNFLGEPFEAQKDED